MGQCQTKQELETISLNHIQPKITQVAPNPPKRRLRRTRSKIILEMANLSSKP
jgi:hypothetical protein